MQHATVSSQFMETAKASYIQPNTWSPTQMLRRNSTYEKKNSNAASYE